MEHHQNQCFSYYYKDEEGNSKEVLTCHTCKYTTTNKTYHQAGADFSWVEGGEKNSRASRPFYDILDD